MIFSRNRFIPSRHLVPLLFSVLVLLQILDAHSTLSARAGRCETNMAINWLGSWVGFGTAVLITKAFAVFVLLFLFRIWRLSKGIHDGHFVVILTLLAVIYGVIDANNYLS